MQKLDSLGIMQILITEALSKQLRIKISDNIFEWRFDDPCTIRNYYRWFLFL